MECHDPRKIGYTRIHRHSCRNKFGHRTKRIGHRSKRKKVRLLSLLIIIESLWMVCCCSDDEPVMASLDGYRTLLSRLVIIDLESNEGMDRNLRIRENVASHGGCHLAFSLLNLSGWVEMWPLSEFSPHLKLPPFSHAEQTIANYLPDWWKRLLLCDRIVTELCSWMPTENDGLLNWHYFNWWQSNMQTLQKPLVLAVY